MKKNLLPVKALCSLHTLRVKHKSILNNNAYCGSSSPLNNLIFPYTLTNKDLKVSFSDVGIIALIKYDCLPIDISYYHILCFWKEFLQ